MNDYDQPTLFGSDFTVPLSRKLIYRPEVDKSPDLMHRVRGLSFFKRHLAHGIASIGRREGLAARFEDASAAPVFLNWIDAVFAQKAYAYVDRRDYIIFGAGILLKTLLEEQPIRLLGATSANDSANPIAMIWPQGFLATSYCLSLLDAVLDQEGFETFSLASAAGDTGVWKSFRENVTEDPRLAIPYLDLFIGNEPNWQTPTWARSRPAQLQNGKVRLLM